MSTPVDSATAGATPIASIHQRGSRKVDRLLAGAGAWLGSIVEILRTFAFVFYVVLAMLAFWFWLLTLVVLAFRMVLHAMMWVLLKASGGTPPSPTTVTREQREILAAVVAPVVLQLLLVRGAAVTYWHWSLRRKSAYLLLSLFFIVLPLVYIVPRPQYVQVIDDNALSQRGNTVTYLVHAVDLLNVEKTREYESESAWWLLKFDPQVVKSRIQPGRFYRLWVVGVRWQLPALYPNIVGATEVDRQGRPVPAPSLLIPTGGQPLSPER